MKAHSNERGLILVNSKKEQDDIINLIQDSGLKKRLTYVKYQLKDEDEIQKDREEIQEKHKSRQKPNSVIISPVMWEGVNLKDDLGRFCIIAKAPFAPSSGEWAKAKTRLQPGSKWAMTLNFFKLIQGCGRCSRSIDDHSVTYLLDKTCEDLIEQIEEYQKEHKDYNIKWFTDAIRPWG